MMPETNLKGGLEMDCECNICQDACKQRPGRFAPGEVAKAANAVGMTPKAFFDAFLGVDWYHGEAKNGESTFMLAPATDNSTPGCEYPFDPRGQCVFYRDGKCSIHATKPAECRFYDHEKSPQEMREFMDRLVQAWIVAKDEIVQLLGREPVQVEPSVLDKLSLMAEVYVSPYT